MTHFIMKFSSTVTLKTLLLLTIFILIEFCAAQEDSAPSKVKTLGDLLINKTKVSKVVTYVKENAVKDKAGSKPKDGLHVYHLQQTGNNGSLFFSSDAKNEAELANSIVPDETYARIYHLKKKIESIASFFTEVFKSENDILAKINFIASGIKLKFCICSENNQYSGCTKDITSGRGEPNSIILKVSGGKYPLYKFAIIMKRRKRNGLLVIQSVQITEGTKYKDGSSLQQGRNDIVVHEIDHPVCKKNEIYLQNAFCCEGTCYLRDNFSCSNVLLTKCACKQGYIRKYFMGSCISIDQCPDIDFDYEMCYENEKYLPDGPRCEETCRVHGVTSCDKKFASDCVCKQGYVRKDFDELCIPVDECPKIVCDDDKNEQYSDNASCQATCEVPEFSATLCANLPVQRGCICKLGFVREHKFGMCIPIDKCPPAPGEK